MRSSRSSSFKVFVVLLNLAAVAVVFRVVPQMIEVVKDGTFDSATPVPTAQESRLNETVPEVDSGYDESLEPSGSGTETLASVTPRDADSAAVADFAPGHSATSESPATPDQPAAPSVSALEPIRQEFPLHPKMITPGNFEYLGAIRPPRTQDLKSRFGYGGGAVTWSPNGDPDGPDDGFPGSLYLVGFPPEQMVTELSIPVPVRSRQIDDLSVAELLQPFGDITGGLRSLLTGDSSEPFMIGGMQVTGNRLHWTLFKYYNVSGIDMASHAVSSLKVDSPESVRGLWHLGPAGTGIPQWHSYKHAGYIAAIPSSAERQLGGKNLMSGLQISTGLMYSSQGPALFAYRLPDPELPPDSSLDAVPLVWYSQAQPLSGHHPADRWTGAAWLTLGDKQVVVVAGRKAHGEVYYGVPRANDCYEDKGYHGSSYEAQLLFYSPEDLISAGQGQKSATGINPVHRWDKTNQGGGIDRFMYRDCRRDIGGMTYDRGRNLLYIVEMDAGYTRDDEYEPIPVIHVFRIVE